MMTFSAYRWKYLLLIATLLFLSAPFYNIYAQVCYPQRTINQFRCVGVFLDCSEWRSEYLGTTCSRTGSDATNAKENCEADCPDPDLYPGGLGCSDGYCVSYLTTSNCQVEDFYAGCTAPPDCKAVTTVVNCVEDIVNSTCTETTQTLTYGCWGPGEAPTPTLAPGEPTPTPGGPTPTPIVLCPNGACDIAETCSTCPADCGVCPTATVNARAVTVGSDTSCTAVAASADYLSGTSFSLSPAVDPASQTQSGGSYVSWGSVPISSPVSGDAYTLFATPPSPNNILKNACYTKTGVAPYNQGLAATIFPGETVTWELGYGLPGPWAQTGGGGNVYAAGKITSLLPSGITPRSFALDGDGGYPGTVTYGSSYDFDISTASTGGANVSSTNWLISASRAPKDYYEYFRHKFGSPTTPDFDNPITPVSQPSSRTKPYYVEGDITTTGDWVVGDGEMLILLVDGSLTIGGKINLTGTGFAAFIARGNITVDPEVGVPYASSSPVVEGLYITSPTGTFVTGPSTNPGTERFIGRGIFVAGDFLLERDLTGVGANDTTSSELFLYNPRLFFAIPSSMQEVNVTWREVAP